MIVRSDEYEDVAVPDGGTMRTHLFRPAIDGRFPGVLFFSEIYQVTAPIRRLATLLAGNGYVVAVPEVYHEFEAPGMVLAYDAAGTDRGNALKFAKPIAASAVYPALVMAVSIHQERKGVTERLQYLEERVRLRPLVHAAVEKLMNAHGVDEERAYSILRNCAMRRRLPMEQIAAFIIGGIEPLPEAG